MPSLALSTPLGRLTLTEADGAIVALDWSHGEEDAATPLLVRARDQLAAYFGGRRTAFDLPLRPEGTEFQRRVWDAMLAIPHGETRTYGDLAKDLSSSARAVGTACGRNPVPILIPCHRVVGKGGALTGYSGGGGLDTKRRLLLLEGGSAQGRLAI